MATFRPIARTAAVRTAVCALAVAVAAAGLPAATVAAMSCRQSAAHCRMQAPTAGHCASATSSLSCVCHGPEAPAGPGAGRTNDLVPPAGAHPALLGQAPALLATTTPLHAGHSAARARSAVSLRILHASLLI